MAEHAAVAFALVVLPALLGDGDVETDDVERVAAELRGVLLADGEVLGVGVVGEEFRVVDDIRLVERQLGRVGALAVEPRPRVEIVELDGVEALAAQRSTIGATWRAARWRRGGVLMSTRYSPPYSGSSPISVSTRSWGQLDRSSRRSTPRSSSCVWKALT